MGFTKSSNSEPAFARASWWAGRKGGSAGNASKQEFYQTWCRGTTKKAPRLRERKSKKFAGPSRERIGDFERKRARRRLKVISFTAATGLIHGARGPVERLGSDFKAELQGI